METIEIFIFCHFSMLFNGAMVLSNPIGQKSPSVLQDIVPFGAATLLTITFTNIQSRATGIADHILPLGEWFNFQIESLIFLSNREQSRSTATVIAADSGGWVNEFAHWTLACQLMEFGGLSIRHSFRESGGQ